MWKSILKTLGAFSSQPNQLLKIHIVFRANIAVFDGVLDDRLADRPQQLPRHGLGGRKEPRAQALDRKYSLANDAHRGTPRGDFSAGVARATAPGELRLSVFSM